MTTMTKAERDTARWYVERYADGRLPHKDWNFEDLEAAVRAAWKTAGQAIDALDAADKPVEDAEVALVVAQLETTKQPLSSRAANLIRRLHRQPTAKEKSFPVMPQEDHPSARSIPWSVAEKAYSQYVVQYGRSQTLERMAERGGFYAGELDDLYPKWREEVEEIHLLRQQLAAAKRETAEKCSDIAAESMTSHWASRKIRRTFNLDKEPGNG